MPAPGIPNIIDCGICSLHPAQPSNVWVVEELFRHADVRKFYVLRDDHAANIRSFCQYIIAANIQKAAMNFIIYDNYSFPQVMLDICTENHESEGVARKCGFTKPNDGQGYIDPDHMELGFRFRWYKQLAGQRTIYFNQAVHCYRQKDYIGAINAFRQALHEPYQPDTPYTDAQIYSNMGMTLSSVRQYREAFNALKKAQSLGLNNPSIEKELLWLRNNQGLY